MATTVSYKPGDLELQSCLLFNYNKKYIDIRYLLLEFNIYHDLYTMGTQCELVLADGNGLIELLPIVGEEKIILTFKTPGTDFKVLNYVFQVYKLSNRYRSSQRGEVFVLYGTSQETVNNAKKSIRKAYSDIAPSELIRSIYENYLRPTEDDFGITLLKHRITIQDVFQTLHVIPPNWAPYDLIRYIIQESYDSGNFSSKKYENNVLIEEVSIPFLNNTQSSNFVFFQKSDGWYFQTIDSLIYGQEVDNFYYTEAAYEENINDAKIGNNNEIIGKTIGEHQKISNLEFENQFDTLRASLNGMYYNNINTIDPIYKKFNEKVFEYNTEFRNMAHLEENKKTFGSDYLFTKNSVFLKNPDYSAERYIVSNLETSYPLSIKQRDSQLRNPRQLHNFMHYDIASRLKLNNIRLSVTIPGNTDLEIGDVVNLHIPQVTEMKEYLKSLNLLYDKKFLITALRHTYTKESNHFYTIIECVKDSYARPLIDEEQFIILEQEIPG